MTAPAPPRLAVTTAPTARQDRADAGDRTSPVRTDATLVPATVLGLVVALASSLWQLTKRPLWIDEAISLGATNQLRQTIRGTGGTMALYYVLLDGWTAVFGTSPAALRTLSLSLALATIVVGAALARRLLPTAEAALAVIVLAGLPALVRMAQDARSYALVMALTTGCWLCLARAVELDASRGARAARPWFLALVPLAAAGVLAQGLFSLQLPALLLSVLVLPRRWTLAARVLPAVAAGLAAVITLMAIGAGDVADWIPPLAVDQLWPFAASLLAPEGWVMAVLGALIAVGATVLVRRGFDRAAAPIDRWRALAPVWWAVAPTVGLFALSTVRPTLLARYVFASLPAIAVLVAVGAVRIATSVLSPSGGEGGRSKSLLRTAALGALVVVLVAALAQGRIARGERPYEDWDAVVELVATEARPGDGLIFPHAVASQSHRDTVRAPFEAAWSRVEAPAAVPVALSPARPLGEVRRFDALGDPGALSASMVRHERIWVVQFPSFGPSLREVLAIEPAHSRFALPEPRTFATGVQVFLLVRSAGE